MVKDGLRRMYEVGEDIFYYIALYNQDYSMPPKPEFSMAVSWRL